MVLTLRRAVTLIACIGASCLVGACSSSNTGSGSASTPTSTPVSSPAATVTATTTVTAPASSTPSSSSASSSSVNVGTSADLSAFTGTWYGHSRVLTITSAGVAKESIGDGCCDPQLDLTLQLTASVPGPPGNTVATVKVTAVTKHPGYDLSTAAPVVGASGLLALADGVITDSFTGTTYCNAAAQAKSTCGA